MPTRRPLELYLLLALLLIHGIVSLYVGMALLWEPDGKLLQLTILSFKKLSPSDLFILGWLLVFFQGLLSLLTIWSMLMMPICELINFINPYYYQHWSWTSSLMVGILSLFNVALQQCIINYYFLHPYFIIFGIMIILLTLAPRVQLFYRIPSLQEKKSLYDRN